MAPVPHGFGDEHPVNAATVPIHLSRLLVAALAIVLSAGAASSVDGRSAAPCATEPSSQFLEQLQRDAYGIDLYWRGALDARREAAERVAREFPDGTPGFPSPHLKASLRAQRLPTCYE